MQLFSSNIIFLIKKKVFHWTFQKPDAALQSESSVKKDEAMPNPIPAESNEFKSPELSQFRTQSCQTQQNASDDLLAKFRSYKI